MLLPGGISTLPTKKLGREVNPIGFRRVSGAVAPEDLVANLTEYSELPHIFPLKHVGED
jgi:hypothetical protein